MMYKNINNTLSKLPFKNKQSGVTLVELIIGIVILSIVLLLFLMSFKVIVSNSADPMLSKQMVMIAQSMMDEVQSKPFTKDSVNGYAGPYTDVNRAQFDAISDYSGLTMNGIKTISGTNIAGLNNYNLSVNIQNVAVGTIVAANVYQITVTVTIASDTFKLKGYRINYE